MDELALFAKERMQKTILNLKETFNTLRTGRANAAVLDKITVEYNISGKYTVTEELSR